MDRERYDLFYGSLRVGTVIRRDADFPNLWGSILYDASLSEPPSPEVARLAKFIALGQKSIQLLNMWDGRGPSPELDAVNAEMESTCLDFVDSEEWYLVDGRGHRSPILCPVPRDGDEIVWRWNPALHLNSSNRDC